MKNTITFLKKYCLALPLRTFESHSINIHIDNQGLLLALTSIFFKLGKQAYCTKEKLTTFSL